jgi:hypothetical protein
MTEQVTEQVNGAETAPAQAPDLNVNDLLALRNLIDVVTQRGAFKANELSSVGILFDKLEAFLQAVQAQQAQQQSQEDSKGE